MPHRTRALGRFPTTTTSLTSSSRWNSSWPSVRRRSSVTQRLLRLTLFHTRPMPSRRSPQVLIGSPAPGCSTLMTSAPNSPRAVATIGPAASVAASTTRTPRRGPRAAATSRELGGGEAEGVAERGAGVPIAERTSTLKLGNHEPDDVLVRARGVRRRDDEAVARVALEPLLHLVGDLGPRPDEAGPLEERGPVTGEVAERDRLAPDVLPNVLYEAADAGDRSDELVGDGRVEFQPGEVVVHQLGQERHRGLRVDELVEEDLFPVLGLEPGFADHGVDHGQHLHRLWIAALGGDELLLVLAVRPRDV